MNNQLGIPLLDTVSITDSVPSPQGFPRSPLRYPGGKNRAIKTILGLIPKNEPALCSPFLGGASVELACTLRMNVLGSDIFGPLVDFWQVLLENKNGLVEKVKSYFPLEKRAFYDLQQSHEHLDTPLDRAAAFFVLNRSSFSGTTLSGGMSPGHPRFTPSSIKRLIDFHVEHFSVEQLDFKNAFAKHPNAFFYLDPPYLIDQALYGIRGNTHKGFEHKLLADILQNRDRWILSYNDSPEIRLLYKDFRIITPQWSYGMSRDKKSREVLILSEDVPYDNVSS